MSFILQSGDLEDKIIDTDAVTYFVKVKGLVNYATWSVRVAAFTIGGEGPSEEYLAGKRYVICSRRAHTWLSYFEILYFIVKEIYWIVKNVKSSFAYPYWVYAFLHN